MFILTKELDICSRTVLFSIVGPCGYGACEMTALNEMCCKCKTHTGFWTFSVKTRM